MKLAGLALGKVRAATAVDAIVAAFAVERTGIQNGTPLDLDNLYRARLSSSAPEVGCRRAISART